MKQRLVCPACGAEVSLEQFTQAADMLALHRAAAAYGEDWGLVREYLELFRGKAPLKVPKLLRLAREVWEMWKSGRFAIGGQWYEVGGEEFREALRTTCNQVGPGLTNHNYLKKVLVAAAEKTSQRRERELREKEERLATGRRTPSPRLSPEGGEGEEAEDLPEAPEWRKQYLKLLKRKVAPGLAPDEKARREAEFQRHLEEGRRLTCGNG